MDNRCVVCNLECGDTDSSRDVIHKGVQLASFTSSTTPQPYITVSNTKVFRYEGSESFSFHVKCADALSRRRQILLWASVFLGVTLGLGALLTRGQILSRETALVASFLLLLAISFLATSLAYAYNVVLSEALNPTEDDMGKYAAALLLPVIIFLIAPFGVWYELSRAKPIELFPVAMVMLGSSAFCLFISLLALADTRKHINQLQLARLAARKFRTEPTGRQYVLWNSREIKGLGFKI